MALSLCRTTVDDSARELMEHGTAAFPIACYHDDLQAEPVPWHWHEELEVLVVSEGMILATAGGEKFRLGMRLRRPAKRCRCSATGGLLSATDWHRDSITRNLRTIFKKCPRVQFCSSI